MMIVHIAPNAPYNDYWGYQDNLLPKYQRKLGYDVVVIITNRMHKDGKIVETESSDYVLNDGVRIIRRPYKKVRLPKAGILTYIPVYKLLEEIKPDFIFYHGLISYTIVDVIKYIKKNRNCKVVQDNHLDYNIGTNPQTFKEKIIRTWYRYLNKYSVRYVKKVYGVTPWRKTYAEDYFRIPEDKTDVLIMGADDEEMNFEHKFEIRKSIRKRYQIDDKDFLIVTGGKIDSKKKTDVLMKACNGLKDVKLIIFGEVEDGLKKQFNKLLENKNIIYIGWIAADKVYEYFYASDLVIFPGQHSVLWEQACASKVPCVFGKWEGMDHVNNGGNSDFISPVNEQTIREKILELKFTEKYYVMKRVAESENTDIYLYSNIAKKSLECVKG